MKRIVASACVLGLLVLAPAFAAEEDGQPFTFKYSAETPLTYNINVVMDIDTTISVSHQTMDTSMQIEMDYRVNLKPEEMADDGQTTLLLEPSSIKGNWNISGPGGNVVMELEDREVMGTVGGEVFIDTRNDIGESAARSFMQELTGLYLSGKFTIDETGDVGTYIGDPPFVEFWEANQEGQVGFFGIIFPGKPVAIGETWQEDMTVAKIGDIQLEEPGLNVTTRFTREEDEGDIAQFRVDSPFRESNLIGMMDQGVESVMLNIDNFKRDASGLIRFDAERGVLLSSHVTADANAEMRSMQEDNEMTMVLDMNILMDLQLIED